MCRNKILIEGVLRQRSHSIPLRAHTYYVYVSIVMRSSKMSLNSKNQTKTHCHCMPQFQSCITLKTPSKLSIRSQRCSHFSDVQNSKIQRKLNTIIGSISKSILASSDLFCLIISQLLSQHYPARVRHYVPFSYTSVICCNYFVDDL